MKPNTAIILVAILVLVIGAVGINNWISSSGDSNKDTRDGEPKSRKIFPEAPSGASQVVIAPRGARELVFDYVKSSWRMTKPISAPADADRLTGIKDMLSDMVYERVIEADDEENDNVLTGLNEPRWVVTMVDDLDVRRVVKIGSNVQRIGASGIAAYVQVGDKTYIVAEDFADRLSRPVSEFRSKKVFDVQSDRIVGVSVAGMEHYALGRADDKWHVERPVTGLADADKVKDLLDKIEALSVDEFVDDTPSNLARYGLKVPVLTVKVEVQPAKVASATQPASKPATAAAPKPPVTYGVALGAKTDEDRKIFARLTEGGGVFTLDAGALTDLQPKLLDLRDKKIAEFTASLTSSVELVIAGAKGTLTRKGRIPKWTVALPEKGPGDMEAINKLLDAIKKLEAKSFADMPNAVALRGLSSPRARITVQSFTDPMLGRPMPNGPKFTVLVGAEGPDGVAIMREGQAVAVVSKDDVKALLQPPARYWEPTLLDIGAADPREKIVAISLQRLKAKPVKLAVRPDGNWQMKAPVDTEADRDNVIRLLDRVEKLKATHIEGVGPKAHEKYAKSKAKITLDVTTESEVLVPTSQPTSKPASQPASRPASRPTSKPASQPTSKPASQPTSRPASQPASRPGPKFKTVVKTYRIHVVMSGIRAYAWIEGRDVTVVGEFEKKLFSELSAEYRSRRLWTIEPKDVTRFKIMSGKDEHVLRRDGEAWRYTASSSFKVDAEKVKDFLNDVKELKALRFVRHAAPTAKELKDFGLDEPWLTLALTVEQGLTHRIVVSARGTDKTANRYATVDGIAGVFLLSSNDIGKLSKLPQEDFEKK